MRHVSIIRSEEQSVSEFQRLAKNRQNIIFLVLFLIHVV